MGKWATHHLLIHPHLLIYSWELLPMAGATAEKPERVSLFGVRVDRVTMERTLELIDRLIRMRSPAHVVTLDASMCVIARDDPELRRIVLDAEIVTPDSIGILWACRRL